MKELYHANSTVEQLEIDGFTFQGGVMHWYNVTPRKAMPYDLCIEDYGGMDPLQRIYCQEYIDELLTQEEAKLLRSYLGSTQDEPFLMKASEHGLLHMRKAGLPVGSEQMGYRHIPRGGTGMHYALVARKDYDLPITVMGYFDPVEESYRERIEEGTKYVRRALQMLGVDSGIKRAQVEAVVRELFDREALYVASASIPNVLENIELHR